MPIQKINYERPLADLAWQVAKVNRANGWFDQSRTVSEECMLIVGEAAEAHEQDRMGKGPTERYYTVKIPASSPFSASFEDGQVKWSRFGVEVPDSEIPIEWRKPEGIPSEMADIIIRVLDFCYRYEIDIDTVLAEKLAFNATRGYKHGGKRI